MYKFVIIVLLWSLRLQAADKAYQLSDFYSNDNSLTNRVDSIFLTLNDTSIVAQMIITSSNRNDIEDMKTQKLISKGYVGGVIFFKDSKQGMIDKKKLLDSSNINLPILYSIDAEPSLINNRITDIPKITKTNKINSLKLNSAASNSIDKYLNEIGIKLNFAPVCDINKNKAIIGNRSYGNNLDSIYKYTSNFIQNSQKDGIITTAKHFPGHGYAKGDSHKKRVYINGRLKEIDIYKQLIADSVICIMVGHIDIRNNKKYNTGKHPSSCSKKIVTNLLKSELGFKGIVISDGLEMNALKGIKNGPLQAAIAGCDILCLPDDALLSLKSILEKMQQDVKFKKQIYHSVKKIIRLKICAGLI